MGEVVSAMRADCALILVDSVGGPEVGTETALDLANQFNMPKIIVINKMDRDNASYRKALVRQQRDRDRLIPCSCPGAKKLTSGCH